MKAVIVTASKHGATTGVAHAICDELSRHGWFALSASPGDAPGPEGFDVVVLGSAIYAGRWMSPQKEYIEKHQAALRRKPVFLFSSGPLGSPPRPEEPPADAAVVSRLTQAREHVTFAGKLVVADLSLAERAMTKLVNAPEGDFRPWDDIRAWARRIVALQTHAEARQ